MAILIPPDDGEPREVLPAGGGPAFELEELQQLVGGYLEALRLDGDRWLVINEEGKLYDPPLPYNGFASALMRGRIAADDYIAGPAIICTTAEMGGTGEGEE